MVDEVRSTELAIISSYPTSVSGIMHRLININLHPPPLLGKGGAFISTDGL